MKKAAVLFLLFICLGLTGFIQDDRYANTYACTTGKIHFFSATPLENIEASSEKAVCVFNTQTRKVYTKVPMTSFRFPKKLMEEHFNENYIESEKYPYGILDAVIASDIDLEKDGTHDVELKGTFEIHGVKQDREIAGKLTIKNGVPYRATATFNVKLEDHKIKVPKAVVMNIAESIKVDVDFVFEKYVKK
jgi:hypothetical protein